MSAPNQSETRELAPARADFTTQYSRIEDLDSQMEGENNPLSYPEPGQHLSRRSESDASPLDRWQQLALCSTEAARSKLPYQIAQRLCALPIAIIRESEHSHLISMLMPDPPDAETLRSIRFACGCDLVVDTAPRKLLEKAIDAAYLTGTTEIFSRLRQAEKSVVCRELVPDQAVITVGAVPELLDSVIGRAVLEQASDIHIEPDSLAAPARFMVRFRVDGRLVLKPELKLKPDVAAALFRRIKILTRLDPTGLKLPQDGALTFRLGRFGEAVRLRVSFVPVLDGEKVVLRILDDSTPAFSIDSGDGALENFIGLGLLPEQAQLLRWCLGSDRGAILVSGPTGSGKSTLLASALNFLQSPEKTIVSIEDPVERRICNVTQLEIDRARGLGYQALLVSVLRQDPDVLMIGEIREAQTAATAIDAALTGKLVLSTIHAASVFEVIFRLLEMGCSAELLSISLRLVSSQRLLPLACPGCRSLQVAGAQLGRLFAIPADHPIVAVSGCSNCRGTGYKGRTGVYEFLALTERVRDAICGAASDSLRSAVRLQRLLQCAAADEGYRPLGVEVRRLLCQGEITADSALKALGLSGAVA